MKFSPFNFQAPLAAGGITLMAFNWLQFAVPHGQGSVRLSDINWSTLTTSQSLLYGLPVTLMFVLTLMNLMLATVLLRDLEQARRPYPPAPRFLSIVQESSALIVPTFRTDL